MLAVKFFQTTAFDADIKTVNNLYVKEISLNFLIVLNLCIFLQSLLFPAGSGWGADSAGANGVSQSLSSLLINSDGRQINRVEAWQAKREELKRKWLNYIGQIPKEKPSLRAEVLSTEKLEGFIRQYVRYQVKDGVFTDAYLLIPNGLSGKLPAIVVFHPTVKTHIRETAGVEGTDPEHFHGLHFVGRGYVILCQRCFIFADGKDYAGNVAQMQLKHTNWTGMARMLWDAIRAVDYLESLPNVDTNRIGCFGHSLGAKEVLYAAAFDERYRCAVFSEGGIGIKFSNWDAVWYLGSGVNKPGFDLEHHQLIALIAPRPFLLLAGESADGDKSLPFIEAAMPVYKLLDAPKFLQFFNHRAGHRYLPEAREKAERFMDNYLKMSPRQWTFKGAIKNPPERVTEELPLSDQQNKSGWVKYNKMWDEFEVPVLGTNKWVVGMRWWLGRQPAWFNPTNVLVSDGKLHLTMRKEKVPLQYAKLGYSNYTSAAVHSLVRSSCGYYEIKARAMRSAGSSAFWFINEDPKTHPNWGTEIDVFELCGKSPEHERRYYMTLHVTKTPIEKRHWSIHSYWEAPWRFSNDFHTFGFEWAPDELRWYVDGVLVRTVENTHWHQPLYLIFDSETMPNWFGMPEDADLPSTFSIEYVRAWKRKYD